MQSSAVNVDDYIAEAPIERQGPLQTIRALILRKLPGHEEKMKYGMAAFHRPGEEEPEVAFASQARHISIYYPVPVVTEKRDLLKGLNVGKCCVRYSSIRKLDFDVIEEMLDETIRQYGA